MPNSRFAAYFRAMQEQMTMLVLVLAGIFSILGGAMDWDFFMNSRKAALFVRLFGRTGARVFYVLLGLVLVGAALTFTPTTAQATPREAPAPRAPEGLT